MKKHLLVTISLLLCVSADLCAQNTNQGRAVFEATCGRCHGGDGKGGETGPAILIPVATRTNDALISYLRQGSPVKGMPPVTLADDQLNLLVGYLRSMVPMFAPGPAAPADRRKLTLDDGKQLEGVVVNQGFTDLQLRDEGGKIHLLRTLPASRYREVTSQQDWTSYNGALDGNRFSSLTQISKANVSRVAPLWTFQIPNASAVQVTPIVVNGIMYVTNANQVWALDGGTGREIWHYARPKGPVVQSGVDNTFSRGIAIAGNRVFMLTSDVHMVALNASDGAMLWDTTLADYTQNYSGNSAPLIAGNLVITGHAGGDEGARGFVSALDQTTGKEVWRFWTVPLPGEPGSETWKGDSSLHGAGATWMTGSYDADLGLVYWPSGNPGPDFYGENRLGDNLYTNCILALDVRTGKLRWYFQFTPHDVHDWDAEEPLVLVDTTWQGQPRKLVIQANRNGFFYVLDRTNGEFLLGKSFLEKLNWADGLDQKGRPILKELPMLPSGETYVCPGFQGGTNWYSTSYNPGSGLYYIEALERCNLFSNHDEKWKPGSTFMGGTTRQPEGEGWVKSLRAIDIHTGEIAFDVPQGPAASTASGGLLSTASGLVFYTENSGSFVAADATTGATLWEHSTNTRWRASPMTYMFDNKQYLGVPVGTVITVFGVRE